MDRYQSFEEFWPYYVREHQNKRTRKLHFIGTGLAVGLAATGLLTGRGLLLALAPVAGYGPAWFSHFRIEKNRPATFKYPLYSLAADFVMFNKMLRGTMDAEVERVLAMEAEPAPESDPEPDIVTNMATDGTLH